MQLALLAIGEGYERLPVSFVTWLLRTILRACFAKPLLYVCRFSCLSEALPIT